MDVRAIANTLIQPVNQDAQITIRHSDGYTIGAGRKQVPQYTEVTGIAQVQALDGKSLQKLNGLNIQGVARALYLSGELRSAIRVDGTGGDLIIYNNKTWLVATVLETWPTWTKVAIVEQVDGQLCC
jgi:hypothetical protein